MNGLTSLNSTLKNGEDGKFYVTCISPQFFYKVIHVRKHNNNKSWEGGGIEKENKNLHHLLTDHC